MKQQTETAPLISDNISKITPVEFVSIAISAQALSLLKDSGILKSIETETDIQEHFEKFKNRSLINSAIKTLINSKIIEKKNQNTFKLTNFGKSIVEYIGLLTVPLLGYRKLIANQLNLLKNPKQNLLATIDFKSLAIASNDFTGPHITPLLVKLISQLNPKGTICDLGCGTGTTLATICKTTNLPGLGIDQNLSSIRKTKKPYSDDLKIEIIQNDITKLNGIWEDVEVVLMNFVFHDIYPESNCSNTLKLIKKSFPQMRALIITDIVSPSISHQDILPGFDYIHGLQNFEPRNYEQTLQVISNSDYQILQEIPHSTIPNTFTWILKPKKS